MPPVVMLDVDPVIRLITQDHPDHATRARTLFERAGRGEFVLHVTEGVVVDVVYILAPPRLYHRAMPNSSLSACAAYPVRLDAATWLWAVERAGVGLDGARSPSVAAHGCGR